MTRDPIKRRLDLLDEHFLEKESLLASFLGRCPLVFAACGIVCGIAIANTITNLPVWVPLVMLIVITAFCVFLLKNK